MIRHCITVLISASILILGLNGCQTDFPPEWRVLEPRILGISATPPTLDVEQTAKIEATLYHKPAQEVEYNWSWCPVPVSASNQFQCPREQLERLAGRLEQQGQQGEQLAEFIEGDFEPTDSPTVEFPYPTDRQTVNQVCQLLQRASAESADAAFSDEISVLDCEFGFDVAVRLEAVVDGQTMVSKKQLTLVTTEETQINENPVIERFLIRPANEMAFDSAEEKLDWVADLQDSRDWHEVPTGGSVRLIPDVRYQIRSGIEPDSVQTYRPPGRVGSGQQFGEPEEESFEIKWFLERGKLKRSRRLFAPETNTLEVAGRTRVDFEDFADKADYRRRCPELSFYRREQQIREACNIDIWSIVRDGRLGTEIKSMTAQLLN